MVPRLQALLGRVARGVVLFAMAVYFLLPLYWTVVSSFRNERENLSTPVGFFVDQPTLNNYRAVFENTVFMRSILSSLVIAGTAMIASLFIGSLAAFALAKLRFRFTRSFLYLFLAMTTFPSISLLSGLFQMSQRVRAFDAANTWISIPTSSLLVTIYLTFTLPLSVWLLTNLFSGIPESLIEAARVDGASYRQIYTSVIMPLAVPALVSVGLLVFITAWQEYLFAVTLTTFDPDLSTVPVAVTAYAGLGNPIGRIMAAIVISTVPLVILTVMFQHRIVVGMTAGSVKS